MGGDEKTWELWHEHRGSVRRYALQGRSPLVRLSWLKDLKELQQRSILPTNSKPIMMTADRLQTSIVVFMNLVVFSCCVCVYPSIRPPRVYITAVGLHGKDRADSQTELQGYRIASASDHLAQRSEN